MRGWPADASAEGGLVWDNCLPGGCLFLARGLCYSRAECVRPFGTPSSSLLYTRGLTCHIRGYRSFGRVQFCGVWRIPLARFVTSGSSRTTRARPSLSTNSIARRPADRESGPRRQRFLRVSSRKRTKRRIRRPRFAGASFDARVASCQVEEGLAR